MSDLSSTIHESSISEIVSHLTNSLSEDEFLEIRVLTSPPMHGAFRSAEKILSTVRKYNGKANIYFGLNPRKLSSLHPRERIDSGLYRGLAYGEKDISRINHILIDFDWRHKTKNSAGDQLPSDNAELKTIAEVARSCREFLKKNDIPNLIALSGNGFHILVQTVDHPVQHQHRTADFLEMLEDKFGTDSVTVDAGNFDTPRICKLYGTLSVKKGATQKRKNRVSKIFESNLNPCNPLKLLALSEDDDWTFQDSKVINLFKENGLYRKKISNGRHIVDCPFQENHGSNSNGTSTTVIFDGSEGKVGFKCFHNSCMDKNLKDVLRLFKGEKAESSSQDGGFNFLSTQDLLELKEPEQEWLVDQHLLIGGTSIIAGRPKSGKTELARSLAFCVSQNENWLGKKTQHGRVLFLAHEDKPSMLQKIFKQMGVDNDARLFTHVGAAPENAFERIKEEIILRGPILVIIDTMLRFEAIKDVNDYSSTNEFLKKINTLSRDTDCHIMLIHHTGKGSENSGQQDDERAVLGSTALSGGVDSILIVSRKNNVRYLSSSQRYGEDLPSSVITMDPNTRHLSLDSRQEFQERSISDRIVELLKTGDKDRNDLQKSLNVNTQKFTDVLRNLVTDNVLVMRKDGKRHIYSTAPSNSSLKDNVGEK